VQVMKRITRFEIIYDHIKPLLAELGMDKRTYSISETPYEIDIQGDWSDKDKKSFSEKLILDLKKHGLLFFNNDKKRLSRKSIHKKVSGTE
jgi:hypothetical protein